MEKIFLLSYDLTLHLMYNLSTNVNYAFCSHFSQITHIPGVNKESDRRSTQRVFY